MYEREFNESRTSLTTNSSRSSRIVRKRDQNLSIVDRSKSKNKEDQCRVSFEEYLNKQTKYLEIDNAESYSPAKALRKSESRDSKCSEGNARLEQHGSPSGFSPALTAFRLNRTVMIEKSDRYIGHQVGEKQNKEIGDGKQQKESRQKNGRKRQPTPIKSKKQMACGNQNNGAKNNSSEIFELELRIAGLQETISIERRQKSKIENQLKQCFSDIQNLKEILSQVEIQNKILLNEKRQFEQKIENLQKTVLESETNLNAVQNNLNKLRQTIKENRLVQLQIELKKCQKANELLKQSNNSSVQTINALNAKLTTISKQLEQARKWGDLQTIVGKQSMKEQYLQKELDKIKRQFELERSRCKDERENFLQQKIEDQQRTILELQNHTNYLMIKMHCLEYSKNRQIKDLKESSDAEIKALRVKYSKMVVDMRAKKTNNSSIESPKPNKVHSPLKPKNYYDIKRKSSDQSGSFEQEEAPRPLKTGSTIGRSILSCQQEYRGGAGWEKGRNCIDFALQLSPQ